MRSAAAVVGELTGRRRPTRQDRLDQGQGASPGALGDRQVREDLAEELGHGRHLLLLELQR